MLSICSSAARKRAAVFYLSIAVSLSDRSSATAAEPVPIALPPVIITATRLPTPEPELGSSVSVVTAADIATKQLRTLPDVLRDLPGLNLVQTGGPGGTTAVFLRGTNANHTKILVDGIDVNDPTVGTTDLAHFLTGDIERVEVLRGPQSGLYGADAIGGVINVITKTGSGPAHLSGSIEGGSFGTFNQSAAVSGAHERFEYNADFSHFRSTETPVTPLGLVPPGVKRTDDSYDNRTLSSKFGAHLTPVFDLGLATRYTVSTLLFNQPRNRSDTDQLFTRGGAHLALFDGRFDQSAGLAFTDYHRLDVSQVDPLRNRGTRLKFDWLGNVTVTPDHTVTIGVEHQHEAIDDSPISAATDNDAGFAQVQSRLGDQLSSAVSLRHDANSRFGGVTTFRVAPAFQIPSTDTTLKGSVGSGFKPPSLEDLFVDFPAFGFFANRNLKPERSLGYDIGFEQRLAANDASFGATYFHNDIDQLITLTDDFSTLINVQKATTAGVEMFAEYRPFDQLRLRGDYTYTRADDAILHQQLLRRPKHKASLNAVWQVSGALELSTTLLYVGPRIDGDRDFSVPRLKANGYGLINLAASYELGDGWVAFTRIDNALDRRYEDPTGFDRPGIGVFGGIKVSFDGAGGIL